VVRVRVRVGIGVVGVKGKNKVARTKQQILSSDLSKCKQNK